MNLYNEIDPYAAQWLRALIDAGEIPPGDVNETPIEELNADDLIRYTQCHFFCGIAGWPLALRLAEWPDDEPVWTGSCPCQPFSVAGKGLGEDDPRHLWPAFRRLIAECRPNVVFGEQVAGAAGLRWLSGVQADVEEDSYRLGFAELCAAGVGEKRWTAVVGEDGRVEWEGDYVVGAPHIRQRLFWVADHPERGRGEQRGEDQPRSGGYADGGGATGGVAFSDKAGCGARNTLTGAGESKWQFGKSGLPLRLDYAQRPRLEERDGQREQQLRQVAEPVAAGAGGVGNPDESRSLPGSQSGIRGRQEGAGARHGELERSGGATGGLADTHGGLSSNGHLQCGGEQRLQSQGGRGDAFWSDFDILPCLDGKSRRTQSGLFPLAHGVSGRVAVRRPGKEEHWYSRTGTLRGFGNAIVPQVAAEFVRAYMEVR